MRDCVIVCVGCTPFPPHSHSGFGPLSISWFFISDELQPHGDSDQFSHRGDHVSGGLPPPPPRIPFISIWKISSPVHPTSFVSLCCCLPFGGAWSAATLLKISYNWLAVNAVPPPPCPRKETSPTPTHFCGIQLKAKTAPPLLRAYLSDLS